MDDEHKKDKDKDKDIYDFKELNTKADLEERSETLLEIQRQFKVKRLTDKEKQHVLSIFKRYKVEYTKNSNGYFFNLDKVDIEILHKVTKCVDLIEQKRDLISSLDKKRDAHLGYYKALIENKLKETIKRKREEYILKLNFVEEPVYIKKKKNVQYERIVSTEDPDVLIKEYIQSKKYPKNSIYTRITQTLRKLKSSKRKKNVYNDQDDDDKEKNGIDIERDIDIGDIGDVEDIQGDVEDLENHGDVLSDVGSEIENVSNSAAVEDEYYNENDNDVSDIESEIDSLDVKTEKTDKKNIMLDQFDFYKNLLQQTGLKFDEEKHIVIKKETYIE